MGSERSVRARSSQPRRGGFKPAIGKPFEADSVSTIEALDRYHTSRTRDRIAIIVLGAVVVSVSIATAYGFTRVILWHSPQYGLSLAHYPARL